MLMSYLKSSLVASAWFVFLTFPFMVVKVNTLKDTVEWRWLNILWVALAAFFLGSVALGHGMAGSWSFSTGVRSRQCGSPDTRSAPA